MRDSKGRYIKGHKQSNTGRTLFKKQGEFFVDDKGYPATRCNGIKVRMHVKQILEHFDMAAIPPGFVIHHIDGNKKNFELNNLCVIPKIFHDTIHYIEGKGKKMLNSMIRRLK